MPPTRRAMWTRRKAGLPLPNGTLLPHCLQVRTQPPLWPRKTLLHTSRNTIDPPRRPQGCCVREICVVRYSCYNVSPLQNLLPELRRSLQVLSTDLPRHGASHRQSSCAPCFRNVYSCMHHNATLRCRPSPPRDAFTPGNGSTPSTVSGATCRSIQGVSQNACSWSLLEANLAID